MHCGCRPVEDTPGMASTAIRHPLTWARRGGPGRSRPGESASFYRLGFPPSAMTAECCSLQIKPPFPETRKRTWAPAPPPPGIERFLIAVMGAGPSQGHPGER
ncbi:hypothetical protein SKAU_G00178770 [Synaphobranchus kaupii]|uniref:Uncharacterized protein n=1 Tax=Synaphobranchus kaupii TaxID=118154 RepID=A0A9Q1J1K2_SYNKA|nr:hypothetical protein SKAU_G00178770 [Synaphobranchus kaupii]